MFTIEAIKKAHSKVRSGADFPAYIQDIKNLGVMYYETFVADGHTHYLGANDHKTSSAASHAALEIAGICSKDQFLAGLQAHQQGKTDFPAFISMCAATGIEKWTVCMDKMTCTYYDKAGNQILAEPIPG